MFKIRKQLSKLYTATVLGNISLTGAWVAILASRGYSLVEIGIAETVFHIISLIFEIPSNFGGCFWKKKDAGYQHAHGNDFGCCDDSFDESFYGVSVYCIQGSEL